MKKKLLDKKISLFKESFPEYKISEKGNLYIGVGENTENKRMYCNVYNLTKNKIKDLGTIKYYPKKHTKYVFLLTKTGKVMLKKGNGNFINLTVKRLYKEFRLTEVEDDCNKLLKMLSKIFFIGKKYEFLKNHQSLWRLTMAINFTSLKEFKLFFGYHFISDKTFISLIDKYYMDKGFFNLLYLCDNKVNLVYLLTKSNASYRLIYDLLVLANQVNMKIDLPKGNHRLKEMHDKLVTIKNGDNINSYSDLSLYETYYEDNFIKKWEEAGITVQDLDTPRKLFVQGLKQKHCLGSYYNSLSRYKFLTLTYEGVEYDLQLNSDGQVIQFYGKYNNSPPVFLKNHIEENNYNYKFKLLTKILPNDELLRDYPKKLTNFNLPISLDVDEILLYYNRYNENDYKKISEVDEKELEIW